MSMFEIFAWLKMITRLTVAANISETETSRVMKIYFNYVSKYVFFHTPTMNEHIRVTNEFEYLPF